MMFGIFERAWAGCWFLTGQNFSKKLQIFVLIFYFTNFLENKKPKLIVRYFFSYWNFFAGAKCRIGFYSQSTSKFFNRTKGRIVFYRQSTSKTVGQLDLFCFCITASFEKFDNEIKTKWNHLAVFFSWLQPVTRTVIFIFSLVKNAGLDFIVNQSLNFLIEQKAGLDFIDNQAPKL